MRLLLGMILGALLLTAGVYVRDSSATSTVAAGQTAATERTIVNWDVAAAEWRALTQSARDGWNRARGEFTKLSEKTS